MGEPITLVTATVAAGLDEDEAPLRVALEALGLQTRVAAWDDAAVDWAASSLTVIRSTWDYTDRRDEFLEWAHRVGDVARLVNPAPVLEWNTDKQYLAQLEAAGIPIVPSTFFRPGDEVRLPTSGDVVVKPSVGAGSKDAGRFDARHPEPALAHAAAMLSEGRTVLVQPYQAAVDARGETALLYFGGTYSHSINKGPLLPPRDPDDPSTWEPSRALFAPERITAHEASDEERELGDAVMAALATVPSVGSHLDPPVYARVDVVRGDDGRCCVLEVELTEPSVFLDRSDGAADRFAAVLAALA